ncbi:MAG: glycosyltransferase family 4 protein [Pseudomonadota bacterium]
MSLADQSFALAPRARRFVFLGLSTYARIGGLQHFNRRVIAGLSRLGVTTSVLRGDRAEHVPGGDGVRHRACGSNIALLAGRTIWAAATADVLFVGHINLMPLAALAKLMRPGLRVVLFVHGDEVWNDPDYRKVRPWDRLVLRAADRVSAVSEHTAQRVQEIFAVDPARLSVLPNAVDRIEMQLPAHRPANSILAVTRLAGHDRGKHVDALLRALPSVLQNHPEAILTIIGDGVLRPELEALANGLGISHAVDFKGRVDAITLDWAYREATAFALPSAKEGFGIVYLEAWQHGVPVVTGTEDAATTLVDHGEDGFSVHHDDIDGLAQTLSALLGDLRGAAEMGRAGAAKVNRRYTAAAFENRLMHMIETL